MEAFEAGFLPGNREDSSYQLTEEHTNVDIPEGFIDNDYENPDLDRFLQEFQEREPQVAVIGDAYTREEAEKYQETIDDLAEEYPYRRFVVAPKCGEAFEALNPDTTTLGYANGKSEVQAEDLGPVKFRGWDVHILGGNPRDAYDAIQDLTQPTLDDREPANVVGYDWNGPLRMAYWEYWTPDGWKDNAEMTPRETARRSYEEIKDFLKEKGVWPEIEPVELYGEPVEEPDEFIWMDRGGDPISTQEELEEAYIGEYEERGKVAFQSEVEKKFTEYREGWRPV
ncbi:DUF6610 family protein [Natrinema altunense]|uniref:DUF6610 family protein n=1 Tax=Natrinema altunense TaxID=222984 RepID=UPI0030B863EE